MEFKHDTVPFDEEQLRELMLSMDELVAGVVLRQLLAVPQRGVSNGGLEKLRSGWFCRQGRKASVQLRARLIGYR